MNSAPHTPRVYPRVGGGNQREFNAHFRDVGLSPRGRGKRGAGRIEHYRFRSIPAWAGETLDAIASEMAGKVYPRVGGGNVLRPLVRFHQHGLSPRGRGKPPSYHEIRPRRGSIPAWAGETGRPFVVEPAREVYPRVGGGNIAARHFIFAREGLSPRGRGKPSNRVAQRTTQRSIPAWAGETTRYE